MRILAVLSLLIVPIASAEIIYKYSDAKGNVVFTDDPPADATNIETVHLAPLPTEQERREAEANAAEQREAAGLDEAAVNAATQEKRLAAEQRLREALDALVTTQAQQPDDWQHLADGHKELKPSYFARVDKAQRAVDQARKDLRALGR